MRASPGDLSITLPDVPDGDPETAVDGAKKAFASWQAAKFGDRVDKLRRAGRAIESERDALARGITVETGKTITEAAAEIGFVIAKMELAIADAQRYLAEHSEADNVRPNVIRRRPRGVAVVIGPFNFPIHLAHGAIVAYLLAGNTVIFKPSPLAAGVCGRYGELMAGAFDAGEFAVVQGGAAVGKTLVADAAVRSVCFTGSVVAGRAIKRACVDDISKDVALELGGKNAVIVCEDADLDLAAAAIADAACATTGQRCNSTSRVLVHASVEADLVERVQEAMAAYVPGDPLEPGTRLGPLVSADTQQRYARAVATSGEWLLRGDILERAGGKQGHYVTPSIYRLPNAVSDHPLAVEEMFAPLLAVSPATDDAEAVAAANASAFGLTTSVFTRDRARFDQLANRLTAGNVYHNLPTTLSPGTLPFGGHGDSGNGRPGGRGFIRFATDEQVIQLRE